MSAKKILVIPDTQVKPGIDMAFLSHIGKYVVDKRPDIVVHLGDHFDFPSLSSYDKGTKAFEGRRLRADIDAGVQGMVTLLSPLKALQERQRANKKRVYSPRMVFTLGNHEERLLRLTNNTPELDGLVGLRDLKLDESGWEVYDYLKPVEIEGIYFTHFLANHFTGKPYGGTAMNQLKTVGRSFVVGHKQCLDIAIRPTIDGNQQIGIVAGACYPFAESYKGSQGNNHFRGVVMLHEVENGFALPMPVSLGYLEKKYGQ